MLDNLTALVEVTLGGSICILLLLALISLIQATPWYMDWKMKRKAQKGQLS